MSIKRLDNLRSDQSGFTLVETIVAFAILAFLVAVVTGTLAFGAHITAQQRNVSNAAAVNDLVRTNVTDVIRQASGREGDKVLISSDGTWAQVTINADTAYRSHGCYRLYAMDGKVRIAKMDSMDDLGLATGRESYGLIPESGYLGEYEAAVLFQRATLEEAGGTTYLNRVKLTVTVTLAATGEVVSEVTSYIDPIDGATVEVV